MSLKDIEPLSGGEDEPLIFGKVTLGSVLHPELDDIPFESKTFSQNEMNLIKPDGRRWLVLFSFCFAAWINSILWITFSPISIQVEEYYDVTAFWVNFLSLLFFVIYVPGAFVASWVLDHLGLRIGILVGTGLLALGAIVRMLGSFPNMFYMVCIGQGICAWGQPFIQNSPAKVATHWFPDHQRALATTLGSVANPIGGALGLLVPPVIVGITGSIPILLLVDAILAVISLLFVFIFFKSQPRNPPSITALHQAEHEAYRKKHKTSGKEFSRAIKFLFTDRSYIILFLCYSLNLGAFQALATLVAQLTSPFGYTPLQSGIMGATVVIIGVVSAGIIGKLMDKYRIYALVLMLCYAFAWYWNLIWTSALWPYNFWWLTIIAGLYGASLLPVLPIGVALACEVTYPISEATPIGFMVMGGMIWSAAMIFIMSFMLSYDLLHWACYLVGLQSALSYILMWGFKGELKRTNASKETNNNKTSDETEKVNHHPKLYSEELYESNSD